MTILAERPNDRMKLTRGEGGSRRGSASLPFALAASLSAACSVSECSADKTVGRE